MDDLQQQPPTTPEPAETPAPADDFPDWAKDPAKVLAMVKELREENAKWRKEKKAVEESASKAETQRLTEQGEFKRLYEEASTQLQQLRDELKASQVVALRAKVASELGIPPQLAERLQGESEEELRLDAEKLKAVIPAASGTPKQMTVGVPGGRPAAETDAQRRARLFGSNTNAFTGGSVRINTKE